jgi:hypothetical protein
MCILMVALGRHGRTYQTAQRFSNLHRRLISPPSTSCFASTGKAPSLLTSAGLHLAENWKQVFPHSSPTFLTHSQHIPDLQPWVHPGCPALDLDALIVEVNSRLQAPLIMPRDMRAIVAQLQLLRPPVSNLRGLCALTRDQLAQVLLLSQATVSAEDFHRAVAAIASVGNSMQMLPPSPPSSAAAVPSSIVQPLSLHEQLPFFAYGTLCSGFGNYQRIIAVT